MRMQFKDAHVHLPLGCACACHFGVHRRISHSAEHVHLISVCASHFGVSAHQEIMRGQRGTLRTLAVICHNH